jgi:apolipoprotein N-acyltransferase
MKRIHLLLLSILTGILLSLAWPERGFTPLIFIGFVPLFFIQQHLGDHLKRGMFWYAWLAFLIWNTLTTWWIWYSTDVGSIVAILLNSLFVAVIFYLFHLSKKKLYENKRGLVILIFYWISWEYFHLNWDLSWPWLTLGNAFASTPKWIQWYEYTGVFGGTLWIFLGNILAFHFVRSLILGKYKGMAIINGVVFLLVILAPIIWSEIIYNNYNEQVDPVEIVVIQPNTDPYNEQYDLSPEVLLDRNLSLASEAITDKTRFVVFPESTLYDGRYGIWENNLWGSPLLQKVHQFCFQHPEVSVVIGASTERIIGENEKKSNAARKFRDSSGFYYSYNTAFLLDTSDLIQTHHKAKLTPGVEIMPSWGILKPIEGLALNLGGTVGTLGRDEHPVVFENEQSVKIAPVICYESIYGEFIAQAVRKGAQFIFIITNDGWWGNTPGHRQHFQYALLRAIETRRSIARSANTGISAFINQRGDVFQRTKYWEPAVIRQNLNINDKLTYYTRNGDYIARISVFVSAFILLIALTQGYLRKRRNIE